MFTAIISGYRYLYLQLSAIVGYGWAIVALSFICSVLMLPLMRAVASVVRHEKEYEDVIDPQVSSIKSRYESDRDRHFHIQALYLRYGYSPLSPIKKVLPLFVQVPFLLITYYMLKGTVQLSGVSFFFLSDLGRPDALMAGVNLLPLLMTGVNILTVFATPGFSHKDWIQAIAISLLFLVLLYTAPSALLLYWTLNNVITMIRTLTAQKGAGCRLLRDRLCKAWRFVLTSQLFLAWTTVGLALLACYLFVTCRSMVVLSDQKCVITYMTCYNGMLLVLMAAFAPMILLLKREKSAYRRLLIVDLMAFLLACLSLVGLRYGSADLYYAFKTRADRYICFEVLVAVYLIPLFIRRRGAFKGLAGDIGTSLKQEWALLLVPVALGLHYSFSSENINLSVGSVLLLCLYMLLPCLIGSSVLIALYRIWLTPVSLMRVMTGLMIGLYIIPMISQEHGALCYDRNILARLLVVGGCAFVATIVRNRRFLHVFSCLVFLVALVQAGYQKTIVSEQLVSTTKSADDLSEVIGDVHCVRSNNVYVLIYDSYAQPELLKGLGLYDARVFQNLRENGFVVYDAYSEGDGTLASMSRFYTLGGASGASSRSTVAGDNPYGDFLRREGYKTLYLMCGYTMPENGDRLPGDYYYPTPSCMVPHEIVLYTCILRGILSQNASVFNYYTHGEWIERKRTVLANCKGGSNFVYAHSALPDHNSRNARTREDDLIGIKEYAHRLKEANQELMEDVCHLADDPDSIVIIASDHGPNLLMAPIDGRIDARHLLDKCGTLLAIRWPQDYKSCLKLDCLQNVLVEVLIYLTGDKTLSRYAVEGETVPILTPPLDFPKGAIKKGVLQVGPDKGKSVFEVVRTAFKGEE